MRLESYREPVIPFHVWARRQGRFIGVAVTWVIAALGIGILGYHFIGHLAWIDAILEASMILGGMGAIAPMKTVAVKLFASGYALFSGFVAISTMGIMLTPLVHRVMHRLHADPPDPDTNEDR